MTIPAFPLQWPVGWKRTAPNWRTRARFAKKSTGSNSWTDASGQVHRSLYSSNAELSIADGVERVRDELKRMGISDDDLVISSNLQLRLDGFPRSSQREPDDPGIAVYWRDAGDTRCMAIDRYDRVADNLAAVAATLEAMRAIERHGGAEILNRAFTGFAALPGPGTSEHWADVLDASDAEGSYRRLRAQHHPDRGGSADQFQRVQRAWENYQQENSRG